MTERPSTSGFSLKDQLFNKDSVSYLAGLFSAADNTFDAPGFVRATMKRLTTLELKERIVHIACSLEDFVSPDFRVAAKHIVAALPPPLDPTKTDNDFGEFIFAPLGEFVVRNGLAKQHLTLSLKTLKAITMRFSMEDAIRAFINTHTSDTLRTLDTWSTDAHYHVRRLVSEGTRPILPWSKRLIIDPTAAIPLLDTLHADPTRYVTRSVANHLNDIAKSHPEVVIDTLARWQQLGQQRPEELQWMSRHALRTLVKQGHARALAFLGFHSQPEIRITTFRVTPATLHPGESIELSFEIHALRDETLMIDYVIDFVKANGKHSPKVHKLTQLTLAKGQSKTITKRHRLHANATTYTLYAGLHHVTLQVNGVAMNAGTFELR